MKTLDERIEKLVSWRDEQSAVEAALAELLPTLKRPHLSVPLAVRLAPLTGLPEARIRKILLWIAKAGHPHATQDGGKVRVYGHDAVLWRWHPTPKRLPEAAQVDTQDW